ncbi:hypothetical protein, partial [Mycobacterium sp.]|uniref:hypothetical protein n=1 Tax=Mycobacterium sp. TaxID=1785 RepID=UPI002C6D87EB
MTVSAICLIVGSGSSSRCAWQTGTQLQTLLQVQTLLQEHPWTWSQVQVRPPGGGGVVGGWGVLDGG